MSELSNKLNGHSGNDELRTPAAMTHNAGGSTASAEPWQPTRIELNPCDFCGARLYMYWSTTSETRIQHGDNPEHSRIYGPEFLITEGYLPFITSIHEREQRVEA